MGKYQVTFYAVGDDRVVSSLRQEEEVEAASYMDAEEIVATKHQNIWISNILEVGVGSKPKNKPLNTKIFGIYKK